MEHRRPRITEKHPVITLGSEICEKKAVQYTDITSRFDRKEIMTAGESNLKSYVSVRMYRLVYISRKSDLTLLTDANLGDQLVDYG